MPQGAKREEVPMNKAPADVLVERVASSLQRALAYNEAGDHENTRKSLIETRDWLNKLREAMR